MAIATLPLIGLLALTVGDAEMRPALALAAKAAPATKPCAAPEHRQFDFWLGEWDVTEKGKATGANRITRILDGCALREEWAGASGTHGTSLNMWDAAARRWRQPWSTTRATCSCSRGAMLDQVLQLYPGTAVAVAVGDGIVWSTSFGFADVERHKPVSRATQFRIYEVAMPLAATILMRQAEKGRIDLDAPIPRYLPELPDTGFPITARDLSSHLAGARDFAEGEQIAAPCAGAREAVRTLRGRPFVRPAGLGQTMSRYGYLLLSAALESASGKRFSDLLAESVAGPAGMGSTMIDDPRRFLPGRSLFYERGFLGLLRAAEPVDTSCRWGAGGLLSTTEDLVRFGAALLRGELLRHRSLDAMFSSRKTRTGADTGYGLGWYVETDSRGRPFVWHGGRGVGGRAAIVVVPHGRLVTVILSNIEGERLDEHARRIAAFFLESLESSGGADLIRAAAPGKPSPPFAYRAAPAPGE